jgi:hypothetical protein
MRWWARLAKVLLVVLWVAALIGLLAVDGSGTAYAAGGALLTVAVGAAVNTWWVVPVPALLAVAVIVPLAASDDECLSCSDEGWNLVSWITFLFFVLPAMVTLALGVAARRLSASRG